MGASSLALLLLVGPAALCEAAARHRTSFAASSSAIRAHLRQTAVRPVSLSIAPEFDFESAAVRVDVVEPQDLENAVDTDVRWHSDRIWGQMRERATDLAAESSLLYTFFDNVVLRHGSIAAALGALLASKLKGGGLESQGLRELMTEVFAEPDVHRATLTDMLQVLHVDPAGPDLLTVLLHFKGFHALQTHRVAHRLWLRGDEGARHLALMLQGRSSAVFGLDIHPGAKIGMSTFFDHGTGIVIGETASIGNGCYLMHGVTLGSTGKVDSNGARHPSVGSHVRVGASATILGPIHVSDDAVIGAKAIVTKPVAVGATVVETNRVLERRANADPLDLTYLYEI
mmetsp:Transcript_7425/g.25262  ORF Transcript_7425/g.25262 Transcript_7425/m.25262 type:complete len:343 (+) Transcript_7425:47-1075(+)